MRDHDFRRRVLLDLGATDSVADELLAYTENVFLDAAEVSNEIPDDEAFVAVWRTYAVEAQKIGVFECLRRRLIQLRFPIAQGISQTAPYLAATRRGEFPRHDHGLELAAREELSLEIHPTAAGHIPLLIAKQRSDFVSLLRALTRRNEPVAIPNSMGACMVSGYNNWDRVFAYRREWEQKHPDDSWDREFKSLTHRKELYQDRFILLSDGPYSGVSAESIGLPPDVWRAASHIIRREHESTHYFTRRVLGSMRNNVFDELVADYVGIVAVAGRFRADWFLKFMGLEESPRYRSSGRFENYTTGLSTEASNVLRHLVVRAAWNLESASAKALASNNSKRMQAPTFIIDLTTCSLEAIAVGAFPSG